jgi:hypothetical protein
VSGVRLSVRSARGALLALGMLSAAARLAVAQAPGEPALPARLGAPAHSAIVAIMDSARAAGLPTTPLAAKAAEGVLKGADDAHIVEAVRSLAKALGEARAALGPAADASVLDAGASALRAGVTPAALHSLGEAGAAPSGATPSGAAALATALVTLVDFVAKGVPPALASQSIEQLLRLGAPESRFETLRNEVEADIRDGQSPEAAVTSRVRTNVQQLGAPGAPHPPSSPPSVPESTR